MQTKLPKGVSPVESQSQLVPCLIRIFFLFILFNSELVLCLSVSSEQAMMDSSHFCPAGLMVVVSVFPMPRLVMMGNASDLQWQVLMTAAVPSVLLFIPYSPA